MEYLPGLFSGHAVDRLLLRLLAEPARLAQPFDCLLRVNRVLFVPVASKDTFPGILSDGNQSLRLALGNPDRTNRPYLRSPIGGRAVAPGLVHVRHPRSSGGAVFSLRGEQRGQPAGVDSVSSSDRGEFRLDRQSFIWSCFFVAVAAAMIVIASFLGKWPRDIPLVRRPAPAVPNSSRIKWLLLAVLPSALLQSVTTHITTDIAAVPLLWTIPLALYLLSFVFAFSARKFISNGPMFKIQPVVAAAVILSTYWFQTDSLVFSISLDLSLLFSTSLVCNMLLVRNRPDPLRLTEFYLWIALGGVIGGRPERHRSSVGFQLIPEHTLTILAAALLVPLSGWKSDHFGRLFIELAAVILLVPALSAGLWVFKSAYGEAFSGFYRLALAPCAGAAVLMSLTNSRRLGLAMIGILLIGAPSGPWASGERADQSPHYRNFFGLLRVQVDRRADWRALLHGTTLHGSQYGRGRPLTEPDMLSRQDRTARRRIQNRTRPTRNPSSGRSRSRGRDYGGILDKKGLLLFLRNRSISAEDCGRSEIFHLSVGNRVASG